MNVTFDDVQSEHPYTMRHRRTSLRLCHIYKEYLGGIPGAYLDAGLIRQLVDQHLIKVSSGPNQSYIARIFNLASWVLKIKPVQLERVESRLEEKRRNVHYFINEFLAIFVVIAERSGSKQIDYSKTGYLARKCQRLGFAGISSELGDLLNIHPALFRPDKSE